jgi:MFS superfamily sulfate permease-like transporter
MKKVIESQKISVSYLSNSLKTHWKADLSAGFIISLIALPLCLGIAMASGLPPMAGLIAGIVGGLFLSLTGGSYLTINGPAAGLAVIVLTSIDGFKQMAPTGFSPEQIELFAYQNTLAVGLVCGVLQILFGFAKAGVLSSFFPSSVVHGMLAAIGIMIFSKQIHVALGVKPEAKEMLEIIAAIPSSIMHLNPHIAVISLISLVILIGHPYLKNKYLKMMPAPLAVVLVAIPLGHYFNLEAETKYLVSVPEHLADGIVFPDFSNLLTPFGIQMVVTYALVASLESLLTAAAIDRLDPEKRTSNFNRELFSKGGGNMLSSFFGGLPIIAEVVRSSANINNGAKSPWANFFHGMFLLIFVVFLGGIIHQIPLSALAAMLMVTGYRLASPQSFIHTYKIGKEQLLIFVSTIIFTLAIDLLVGILAGILVKLLIHLFNGLPVKSIFKPFLTIDKTDIDTYRVEVLYSAVFSNFIGFKRQIMALPTGKKIEINFADTKLVDHTVMENLKEMKSKYEQSGGKFVIIGMEEHKSFSQHHVSARKK